MNNKPNQYDYVLQLFAQADSFRPIFRLVHPQGGFAYSISEAHAVLKAPLSKCGKTYDPVDKFPNCENLFKEHKVDSENKILTNDLLGMFAAMQIGWTAKKQACEKCKGDGMVKCKCCENESDCKTCKGSGESETDVPFAHIYPYGKNIKLFNRIYNPRYINQVLITALALGAQEITFKNGPGVKISTVINVLDAEILLMPITPSSDEED